MGHAFVVDRPNVGALRALNYAPEIERFRSRPGMRYVRLGSVLRSMGPAYGSVFTRRDCDPSDGVELITQGDMFAAEPSGRVIRLDSMAYPERHRIRKWQILIAGAGTLGETELYGRSIIADSRLSDRFVGPHAMALTFEDDGGELNLYAYAFLCSRLGVRVVRSTSYGTKILGLRKDMLADILIPLSDEDTLTRVAALVRDTVEHRELYVARLASARADIEALPIVQEARSLCSDRRPRCVAWPGPFPTLSAWNFASTGGALKLLSARWSARLADIVPESGLFNGPRFMRVPTSEGHGITFMNQRDVFLVKPVPRRIAHPGFDDGSLFAPPGSLLVGGHGTLGEGEIFGRCVIVAGQLREAAFTQDLLRIQPQAGHVASLYAYLSTSVGRNLLRACAVGTKILSMRPDLLRSLPVPELAVPLRECVERKVADAIAARERAERSEDEAIRIIEEEVLPKWLA